MLIVDLNFTEWADLFRGHADMITAMSFNDNSVSVELNTNDYVWRIKRNSCGIELYYYEASETDILKKLNKLGMINRDEFRFLIID